MTSDELVADIAVQSSAPRAWEVKATDSKFYWYDLLTDFPPVPDFRDPIGRYLRRMQFALDATMEKRLMYFLVSRPRLRFDAKRPPSWGFFSSLKLTIPILVGAEQKRESISIEIKVPDDATLKKPTVQVFDCLITLNWGSLIETYSVHDLLQQYDTGLEFPSKIHYVGQTRDTAARLAKGRVIAVNRLCDKHREDSDNFLLIQQLSVSVQPVPGLRQSAEASVLEKDLQLKSQMDALEGILIKYFEADALPHRGEREQMARAARLHKLQRAHQIQRVMIDMGFEQPDAFQQLFSAHVAVANRHVFECMLGEGEPAFKNLMTGVKRA